MRILALDIGSSSVKAGLADGVAIKARGRAEYPTHFDGPRAEVDPAALWRAVTEAARQVLGDSGGQAPDAIAFSTFSPGMIIADNQGHPRTRVITHADRRSTAVAQQLVAQHSKSFWLTRAGNLPYAGSIGASTLAYLHNQSPALFKRARIGQVSSWIGCMLMHGGPSDAWAIDPSQAAFLGLCDIATGTWNAELCKAVRVDAAALPRVAPADSVIGTLGPRAAKQLRLPAGVPIVGGFVDTSAAVLQTPMRAGQLSHSAGSTDVLAMCVDAPRPAEGILTRPVGVGRVFAARWLAVRTIASAGSALQWLRDTMFRELDDRAWQAALKQSVHPPTGHAGADVPHASPTFAGERAAMEQPPGAAYTGLHLGTTREEILAATVAALAQQSAANYHILKGVHAPARTVYRVGGAGALAAAMHAAWPRRHQFRTLTGDNLAGLVLLARRTLA